MRLAAVAPRLLVMATLAATPFVAHRLGAEAVLALLPTLGMILFAWHFGCTLRPGHEPLITRYIREDFCSLPDGCGEYGRALTLFWTLAFCAFAVLNLLPLMGVLSASAAGLATVAISLLLFLGEHAVRARRFPHLPVTLGRTLRAMWQAGMVRHAR